MSNYYSEEQLDPNRCAMSSYPMSAWEGACLKQAVSELRKELAALSEEVRKIQAALEEQKL